MSYLRRYSIGKDFSEEDFRKWVEQIKWWISEHMNKVENPTLYAENVIKAGLNGTKLDGNTWVSVPDNFFKRVKLLCGFDLELGIGVRGRTNAKQIKTSISGEKTVQLPPLDIEKAMEMRASYLKDLVTKYPHLDIPVYKPKVEELAETVVKSRMLANDFLLSRGAELERLSKIRESLHRQIGELMEFLEISPKQRVTKSLDAKNADVGSLIARLESYGESWEEYERLDSLRELIQLWWMTKNKRPDGTPQLSDWELWHATRNRPVTFTCKHGETYTLLGGFLPEEIEAALIQAEKVYGYGLRPIGSAKTEKIVTISSDIAKTESFEADTKIEPLDDTAEIKSS